MPRVMNMLLKIDLEQQPPMYKVSDTHYAATWLLHPNAPKVEPPQAVKKRMHQFKQEQQLGCSKGGKITVWRTAEKLLEIKNLKQHFNAGKPNEVRAIDGISFDIYKGETLGLVGESGCGKSTTGRTIIRLYDATDGEVLFNGENVHGKKSKTELKKFNRKMQMIFQDPYASLNPRMKIADIIAEGIDIHGLAKTKAERNNKVYSLLETVGLNREHANRYPHEFSGGQRQRIGIARALAVEPEFIIADEPISALGCIHSSTGCKSNEKTAKRKGINLSIYCT